MVNKLGVQINNKFETLSFKAKEAEKTEKVAHKDSLLINEKNPALTNLKNKADKFVKSFTTYPKKGFEGSKNANFYEFLSMGTVPYLVGSAAMICLFNAANFFFDSEAAKSAFKTGNKMGLGVLFYGVAKSLSKKLIETPLKMRYGIDTNMPYQKIVYELPEESNKNNLVKHESHKVFESVDFPRWDLLYDNEKFGEGRNAYYDKIAKKMGFDEKELVHSDQKVKPLIKEKLVQTKLFSTLSSYLWAAVGVGVAMQEPWENLKILVKKVNPSKTVINKNIVKDFGKTFVNSCKEFVTNPVKSHRIAGIALLGAAIATTVIGNLATLTNVNKDKGETTATTPIFNPNKEKVVC